MFPNIPITSNLRLLTLEVLALIERLLFLQQMHVAHQRNTPNILAVRSVGQGDAFVVGKVRSIVFRRGLHRPTCGALLEYRGLRRPWHL